MITLEIRQIALIGHRADGADIFFPASGHGTQFQVNGGAPLGLRGHWKLVVRKAGIIQQLGPCTPAPNGRIAPINTILGFTATTVSAADALAKGLAQAVVSVHGNAFDDRPAISMVTGDEDYIIADWTIGPVTQKLTNSCIFEITPLAGHTYELTDGTETQALANGDTMTITNVDTPAPILELNYAGNVILTEFALFYALLSVQPLVQPIPETPLVAPSHALMAKKPANWTGGHVAAAPPFSPRFPLCPVGGVTL